MNPPDFPHEPHRLPLVLGRMENVSAPPKWKEASLSHLLSCVGRKGRARLAPTLFCLSALSAPNTPQKLPFLPQGAPSGIILSSTPVCDFTPAGEGHLILLEYGHFPQELTLNRLDALSPKIIGPLKEPTDKQEK